MMLTFSVVPQTLLVKGFQPTVNQTEKPSPQSPTPINQPPSADSFTPSAVKSRAGNGQRWSLEAYKEPLGASLTAIKRILAHPSITRDVKGEFNTLNTIIRQYIETATNSAQAFEEIEVLKKFLDEENLPHLVTELEKLKSVLEQSEQAKEALLQESEQAKEALLQDSLPLLKEMWDDFFKPLGEFKF